MITSRDRQILRHIDAFGFITIEETHRMIFPELKRGYEYARQRLQYLSEKEKRLKSINNSSTKTKVFIDIDSKEKSISMHKIYTMDFYCHLIGIGTNVEEFTLEKQWDGGSIRSDAFCVFTYEGYRFRIIVETNVSNNKLNLARYDSIKDEILIKCSNQLPRIVVIDDRNHQNYDTKIYQVIRLDYKLFDIQKLFI